MSNSVYCPYCEEEIHISYDDYEGSESFDMECSHCGEEFEVTVEYEPSFSANKITYEICRGCGQEFRYEGKSFPRPEKYKHLSYDEYIICSKCYKEGIFEDYK